MAGFRFGLGLSRIGFKKIANGFIFVICIALANSIFSSLNIQQNKKIISFLTDDVNPYVSALDEFHLLVIESKMYATNWVFFQVSDDDKRKLEELHKIRYPELKIRLTGLNTRVGLSARQDSLEKITAEFEEIMKVQKEIMSTLVRVEDYNDAMLRFSMEGLVEDELVPRSDRISEQMERIIARKRAEANEIKQSTTAASNRLMTSIILFSVGIFVIIVLASVFISNVIRDPVERMKVIVGIIGRGEIPESKLTIKDENIISEMIREVNKLSENFSKTSVFANEIGKNNFSAEFTPLSEKDTLGNALINMRNSLKVYSEEMERKVAERTEEVREKSARLEIAYTEIRDSINYARRIQEAILPSREIINLVFKNSFVFYKPKSIVSGDFYWFGNHGKETMMAAVDCTGHGVPGALMTVMGSSLIHEIANSLHISSPGEFLRMLDRRVIETMQQRGSGSANDGMDIALCRYNQAKNEIAFAGAKRPLMLIRKGEIKEYKGDPFPIGSAQYGTSKIFTEHTIPIQDGDTVYIYSDGYQDQFGGPEGKKFMVKKFRELLLQIQPLPMAEQEKKLEKEITAWMGNNEQTDDLMVIGMRF